MSKALELPYFTISADELANWLDEQPNAWWTVDGDPVLTSCVDFPCPTDELSAELRRIGKSLRMFDPRTGATAHGDAVVIELLNEMADTDNNSGAKTFLLSWEGEDIQWLLVEDLDAAKESA